MKNVEAARTQSMKHQLRKATSTMLHEKGQK